MTSKPSNENPPPRFRSAITASRPATATSFRLRSVDGRCFPPLDKPAAVCNQYVVEYPPDLVAGTYDLLYYREPTDPDSVLPTAQGRDTPTLQLTQDAVLRTPADYELYEQRRWQRFERQELQQRAETAHVTQIEAQSAMAIERDAAITSSLKAIAELAKTFMDLQAQAVVNQEKQTEAHHRQMLAFAEASEKALSKYKTDNVFTCISEGIRQIGTIATAAKQGRDEDKPDRRLRTDQARPALEGRRENARDPKVAKHDDPPSPPTPPAPPAAGAAGKSASQIPAVEIDWIDVCERRLDPPSAPLASSLPAADADQELAVKSSVGVALAALPDELGALVAQMPELQALLGDLGLGREVIEKPAQWSYSWAWRAIKRRIASLSDTSIAWLLSSLDNALGFLGELADLATPPHDLDVPAEGVS